MFSQVTAFKECIITSVFILFLSHAESEHFTHLQSAEGLVHCDWGDGADDNSLSIAP